MGGGSLVPLSSLPAGTRAVVRRIDAGGRGLKLRLLQIGVTPGAVVEVVENRGRGPMLLSVRGSIVAVGRGVAGRILVELLDEDVASSAGASSSSGSYELPAS
ncbi:MAG: FeoA family protein [Thermoproteota archaeon]